MALNLPLRFGISHFLLTFHNSCGQACIHEMGDMQGRTPGAMAHKDPHHLALTIPAASSSAPNTLSFSNNELFMTLYTHSAL